MRGTKTALLLGVAVAALSGCRQVPFDYPREASSAAPPAMESRIGQKVQPWMETYPGESGFYPATSGTEAFGLRLRLIEAAESTLDLQYFLIKPDFSGALIADRLLHAADRGVRIRFLLDDIFTTARDSQLAKLDAHPNIEVRLFNPLVRGPDRLLSFLWQFNQSNRRMHNKSLTADNLITIVGGRNLADEYYAIQEDIEFADFDMLAVGPVAAEVSESFDLFWNSKLSVPLKAFSGEDGRQGWLISEDEALLERAREIYSRAINSPLLAELQEGTLELFPAQATVITDPPEKLTNPKRAGYDHLITAMLRSMGEAGREIIIVTPYFVPGRSGVEFLKELRARGVEISVITNSLASTNHAYVHGGYAPRRKALLRAGVRLFEVMADPGLSSVEGNPVNLTLHTKLVIIDRRLLFVGSLNIDPRSIVLNSEMGLLIDCPEISSTIAQRVEEVLPDYSYLVELDSNSRLRWIHRQNGKETVLTREPGASLWRRFIAGFVALLPVEGQL